MAKRNYNPILSDYLRIIFICDCCKKKIILKGIEPPLCETQISFTYQCKCKNKCIYEIRICDLLDKAYVEIVNLPDSNIVSVDSILYEHYHLQDFTFVNAMDNRTALLHAVEEVSKKVDEESKTILYGSLLCRAISLLDSYMRLTLTNKILLNKKYQNLFIRLMGKENTIDDWKYKDIKASLKNFSFQSMDSLVKILDKVFNLDIVFSQEIANAVFCRNRIVHHQGVGPDGEVYSISKEKLLMVVDEIWDLIKEVDMKLANYNAGLIVDRNTQ